MAVVIVRQLAFAATALLLLPLAVRADGSETLSASSAALQPGSGMLVAGTGLKCSYDQPRIISLSIPNGLSIKQALLYWSGAFDPAFLPINHPDFPNSYEVLVSAGGAPVSVLGTLIGGPTLVVTGGNQRMHVSYRADLTAAGLLGLGSNSLTVEFPALGANVDDGAGLLVIYDDGSGVSPLYIRDGNDYAYTQFTGALSGVQRQVFDFAPAAVLRPALLSLFFSGVEKPAPGAEGVRPNSIEIAISGGGQTGSLKFTDLLNSSSGPMLDVLTLPFDLPPGSARVEVQAFSRDDFDGALGQRNPSSFTWVVAALAIRTTRNQPCTEISSAGAIAALNREIAGVFSKYRRALRLVRRSPCQGGLAGQRLLRQARRRSRLLLRTNRRIISSIPPITIVCSGDPSTGLNKYKSEGFEKNLIKLQRVVKSLRRFARRCGGG